MPVASVKPTVRGFHDPVTGTITYVVFDPWTKQGAIIDPVFDFDPAAGRISARSLEAVIAWVRENGITAQWLIESHAHADHLSGMAHAKRQLGGQTGIGAHIVQVQAAFQALFAFDDDFPADGRQFDHLFADDEAFYIGAIPARALHTPGHTPACITYLVGDAAFTGDTLFMPDAGTARCDFPGGDAATLYRSVQRILALPSDTRLFVCHDYGVGGRQAAWETTVAEQRECNIHVRGGITEQAFVELRTARDRTLSLPALILPSLQVNLCAGELPAAAANGVRYLKIPLNQP